jgi:hypothetical protein
VCVQPYCGDLGSAHKLWSLGCFGWVVGCLEPARLTLVGGGETALAKVHLDTSVMLHAIVAWPVPPSPRGCTGGADLSGRERDRGKRRRRGEEKRGRERPGGGALGGGETALAMVHPMCARQAPRGHCVARTAIPRRHRVLGGWTCSGSKGKDT